MEFKVEGVPLCKRGELDEDPTVLMLIVEIREWVVLLWEWGSCGVWYDMTVGTTERYWIDSSIIVCDWGCEVLEGRTVAFWKTDENPGKGTVEFTTLGEAWCERISDIGSAKCVVIFSANKNFEI